MRLQDPSGGCRTHKQWVSQCSYAASGHQQRSPEFAVHVLACHKPLSSAGEKACAAAPHRASSIVSSTTSTWCEEGTSVQLHKLGGGRRPTWCTPMQDQSVLGVTLQLAVRLQAVAQLGWRAQARMRAHNVFPQGLQLMHCQEGCL